MGGESSRQDTVEGILSSGGQPGEQSFSGVTAVELMVANGEANISEADLPAGTVELAWAYKQHNGRQLDQQEVELRFTQDDGLLRIEDWRSHNRAWHQPGDVDIELTLKHGPGVGALNANHGNGTLNYRGSAAGEISLGNGTLTLSGEPIDDMEVSLGNGELIASWVLDSGQHAISVGNGSVEISLRAGSSVELDAMVALGAIEAPRGVTVRREHLLGASATGSIGDGDAQLDVSVGNGATVVRAL